ncbi:MAG: hypothetical protein KF812_08330 [Fimbriimonadaceae bacterium]|nr:hypothetical protein [Fimbriimonadaceae bacterium]
MKEHDRHLMDLWDGNAAPRNDEDRLWLDLKDELRTLKPKTESRTQFADVMREVRLAAAPPPARKPWWKWAVPSGAVAAASLYFLLIARPDAIPQPEVNMGPATTAVPSGNLATNQDVEPLIDPLESASANDRITTPSNPAVTIAPANDSPVRRTNQRRASRPASNYASRVESSNRGNPNEITPSMADMARPASVNDSSPAAARNGASNSEASEPAAASMNAPTNNGPKVVVVGNRPSASTGVPRATEAPLTDVVFGG